jgi:geranylgeranyl pyrophosphate synthase
MTDANMAAADQAGALSFDEAMRRTEGEINRQLKSTPAVIRQLTSHLSRAVGKNIRAKSLLTCAIRHDGGIVSDAVKIAAAVELLHLATLVHDDIIDDAAKRRSIQALHKKFGEKAAILCGDYLVCMALQLASTVKPLEDRRGLAPKTLPGYLTDVLLGEMRQNQNNRNFALTERQYLKIIIGKTAAMFEASFHAGFLLSDEPEKLENDYLKIGRNTGIIFQLADDCADYESTQKSSKKPVLSDFRTGVVTLPLIYALKSDRSLYGRIMSGIMPQELKRAVEASGGLSCTHLRISEYFKRTMTLITTLQTTSEKKDRLAALLEKAAGIKAAL